VLSSPGLMDPSTEFGNIMHHAMKIKGAQMEQDRRTFEKWPLYFQNTLWMRGPAVELREKPVHERLEPATRLKDEGNDRFKSGAYTQAIEQYEQALGSFRWAKQHDPDWKKKGIRDETIECMDERGEGETRDAVDEFLLSCYNNLAACYLARAGTGKPELGSTIDADYKLCVQACTAALELRPGNSKALYRRARALTEPLSAGDEATDAAIKDLSDAAASAPEDRAVRALLLKLKKQRAQTRKKEREDLSGLFGRGELYDQKSLAEQEERAKAERRLVEAIDKKRTPEDCEREALEAEEVIKSLRAKGRLEDAAALEVKVAEHRQQLQEFQRRREAEEKRKRLDPTRIDFAHPTAEQIEDAKQHGIDLHDPLVVAELQRLQKENEAEEGEEGEEEAEAPREARRGGWRKRLPPGGGGQPTPRARNRRPPPPDVSAIPLREIRRRLDDMRVDYADIVDDRPALEARLLAQYRRPEQWEPEDGDEPPEEAASAWASYAPYVALAAMAMALSMLYLM